MSSISKCPRCQQSVTIPDGVVAEAQVRCPLCAAEYPLSDALAGVPPALIVVEAAAVAATAADAVVLDAMAEIPSLPSLSEPAAAETEAPAEAEATERDPAAETEAEVPTDGIATETAPASAEDAAAAEMAGDVEHELDIVPDGEATGAETDEAGAQAETFDASAFAGLGMEPTESDGKEPPPGVPRYRPRRKAKEKNPVKEVVGIVLGGFFGLLIGYYVLAWAGLSRKLPQIPLPFLPSKQSPKTEDENKTDTESDNAQSRAPDHCEPFDRFTA